MRVVLFVLIVLALAATSACATLSAPLDAGLARAEQASNTATTRAVNLICERISVRQWKKTFGKTRDSIQAWFHLCHSVAAFPPVVLQEEEQMVDMNEVPKPPERKL